MLSAPSGEIALTARLIVALSVFACVEGSRRQQPDDLAQWTLTLELRIGNLDEPDEFLSEVTGLTVGPDDAVYVTQWRVPSVHVFASDGHFLRRIGRGGGGPGEFSQPAGLGWLGDTLWVMDMPVGRINLFLADGTFLETLTIVSPPIGEKYFGLAPVALMADGSLISQPVMAAHILAQGIEAEVPLFRSDRSLERLDTLAFISVANQSLEVTHAKGVMFTHQPMTDHDLHAVLPGGSGLIVVERGAPSNPGSAFFRVTRLQPAGDTAFSKSIHYEPVRLTEILVDSLVAELSQRLRGPAPIEERAIRESLYLPTFIPPVEALVAGRDGTIWLKRSSSREGSTWMVLSEDGSVAARLTAPSGLRLLQAEREKVWGVVRDSLDVPYVGRYRVYAR